ncbi:MAG: hypothetical protein TREMPRED_003261 [Tremellales sp. Tagirdzhanova-0007]|nr:MAG: hypothetical protein TREMPRED_003261 [Tremellales sp. Tagirdzhanova-0007]
MTTRIENEKSGDDQVEHIGKHDDLANLSRSENDIDRKAERKLLLKLDLAILPMTYLSANLDRGNIGNARLQGLQTQLLSGSDTKYSVVLCAFYITYMLFSIPGTLLSKAVSPNYALGCGCLIWGIAAASMAGCHSYGAIIVCRLFIGLGESIFGQAVVLHYSLWTLSACPPFNNRPVFVVFNHSFSLLLPQYKKNEIATRLAAFIGAGVLAGAFGGLIAYGVSHINSKIQTWRILFLIEGLPSTLLGTAVILFLPSRPERSKYLTESERELEFLRLRSQNLEEVGSGIDWSGVKRAFTDWKSYAITNANAQLYTVPPYAVGFVFMIMVNYFSDRLRIRGPFIILVFLINMLGFVILISVVHNEHARYFACFCIVIGGYCTIPLIQSWIANNTGSQSQRAVHLGMLNSLANWGAVTSPHPSLTSPFIFPTASAPRWHLGFGLNLAFSCAAVVVTTCMMVWFHLENKRRDRVEGGKPGQGQKVEAAKLHDLAPGFRYTS